MGAGGAVFALAILVLGMLAVAAYRQSDRAASAQAFTARATLVQRDALRLENAVTRMEASQRGFLASGAVDMTQARDAAYAESRRMLEMLRARVTNPVQARRLARIAAMTGDRYRRMREVASIAEARGLDDARALFAAEFSRAYDGMHRELAAFGTLEERLVQSRGARAREQVAAFNRLLISGTAFALALLLLSGWALLVQLRRGAALQRSLEQSLTLNRLIMDNSPDVVCAFDREGRFVMASSACLSLWGYRPDELAGRGYIDMVEPADRERTREAAAGVMSGQSLVGFCNRYLRADGTSVEVDWSATWSEEDQLMFCVARDATARRRAETAIEGLNAALHAKAEQLERSNRELEAFTYTVSHDLRAPLRHVNGYARMLAEDAGPALEPGMRRYVDNICDASARMGRLIDELLAFSKLGRRRVERSRVDMARLVRDALDEVASDSCAHVLIGDLPHAHADPGLLRQVWTNLLSNAIKYSAPRGADARIEVDGEREDGLVRYRVRDNGVGFDPAHAGKLFGVFQRLHTEDEFDGIGVGLAIVQRIIHGHGGRVAAEAAPGHGATFWFELPDEIPLPMREVPT